MPTRKAATAFKKLEKVVKKADAAAAVFTARLDEAKTWKDSLARAKARLEKAGAITRARGRKALGVGEYAT